MAQGHTPHPLLQRVMSGDALVVPALQEDAHGNDLAEPRTRAAGSGRRDPFDGHKTFVCADGADGFLVSASGRDGPALFYVDRHAPGCTSVEQPRPWTDASLRR